MRSGDLWRFGVGGQVGGQVGAGGVSGFGNWGCETFLRKADLQLRKQLVVGIGGWVAMFRPKPHDSEKNEGPVQ